MSHSGLYIIKIGTHVVCDDSGNIRKNTLRSLTSQIAELHNQGNKIIVISSGAIGFGNSLLDKKFDDEITRRQVLASLGCPQIMHYYQSIFSDHNILCSQVLVTRSDFKDQEHHDNMRACIDSLLKNNIIPIINENDVVAITELMFSDNDELAGLLAVEMKASGLVILTNVDGVYDKSPADTNACIIYDVYIDDTLDISLSEKTSLFGRGGMSSKFKMARNVASLGVKVHIANGLKKDIISDIFAGKKCCTTFHVNP